jgi:hypothetical protein
MASEKEKSEDKIYPGSIEHYRMLREVRERTAPAAEGDTPTELFLAAVIAENLAGLAYILDGIRYSARRQ